MPIGAVLVFEGSPPSHEDFLDHIRSRLHLLPRFRQRLAFPPLEPGPPLWVDDPGFNIAYHVRHIALPPPGDEEQLPRAVGRVFSQPLDRSKPLWELWLVEGFADERFAHRLQDPPRPRRRDLRGRHRHRALRPRARTASRSAVRRPWAPQAPPTAGELLGHAARGLAVAR